MDFNKYKNHLQSKIQKSYGEGITMDEAERLGGEFLQAMLDTSTELKTRDLDTKMKKTGLKAIRARAYLDTLKSEVKLTDAGKQATIDTDEMVIQAQDAFDTAEVEKEDLERVFMTFKEAHIHFRGIAKGRFE